MCKLLKVSVFEYFSKLFSKIVRWYTDYDNMFSMNIALRGKIIILSENKLRTEFNIYVIVIYDSI